MHRAPWKIVTALAAAALGLGSAAGAQKESVEGVVIATGFDSPLFVTQPNGEDLRLFVVEREGLVKVIEDGAVQAAPFMDLRDRVLSNPLQGLQGFVFHPDYMDTGFVYCYYPITPLETVLVRYHVPDPPSYQMDPDSGVTLLSITDTIPIHQGGGLDFGPDGKLYLAIGDRRFEVAGDGCVAQAGDTLVGKLVRLNDDGSIPGDNPFVGDPSVRDEIVGVGLRQPYRMSFDPWTGWLYVGDVGHSSREEVSLAKLGEGVANFGWPAVEGTLCTGTPECVGSCPTSTTVVPLAEYNHGVGCCVIGGYVYRGTRISWLEGVYLYADWCTARVFFLRYDGTNIVEQGELTQSAFFDVSPPGSLSSLGRDSAGELYIVDGGIMGSPGTGRILQLRQREFFADRRELSLSEGGVVEMTVQTPEPFPGAAYWILGSASGTESGFPLHDTFVPMVPDLYTWFTVTSVNQGPLVESAGPVAPDGSARASLVVLPGLDASLAGLELDHLYVLLQGGEVTFASQTYPLTLVP